MSNPEKVGLAQKLSTSGSTVNNWPLEGPIGLPFAEPRVISVIEESTAYVVVAVAPVNLFVLPKDTTCGVEEKPGGVPAKFNLLSTETTCPLTGLRTRFCP